MSINWSALPSGESKAKVMSAFAEMFGLTFGDKVPGNYGFGPEEWNLTELVQSENAKKYAAYLVLDGRDANGKHTPQYGLDPAFAFHFQVVTRQACVRTKDGNRIWQTEEAKRINLGDREDPVPNFDEKPEPGDIVEWKGESKRFDDEKNRPVTQRVKKEWAMRGIRSAYFHEFTVDEHGCIDVGWPHALGMLTNRGFRNTQKPQFRKVGRTYPKEGVPRRITNWWFKEVPLDFGKQEKKKGSKKEPLESLN